MKICPVNKTVLVNTQHSQEGLAPSHLQKLDVQNLLRCHPHGSRPSNDSDLYLFAIAKFYSPIYYLIEFPEDLLNRYRRAANWSEGLGMLEHLASI